MKLHQYPWRYHHALFLLVAGSFVSLGLGADTPTHWVSTGLDQRLVYAVDARGNQLPDFSNCGYEGGGVPIPIVPVIATVDPAPGDAGARIQAAINEVSQLPLDANGFRGAVLLHKGTYPIAGVINVTADGVVLRGEGQDVNGTRLIATGTTQRSLIKLLPARQALLNFLDSAENETPDTTSAISKRSIAITDEYVPVGAHSFHVQDTSDVRVGQSVVVLRPSTENWIHVLGMDRIPQNETNTVKQWTPGSKDLPFRRLVTVVAGNLVTVDAPICCALDKQYGGGALFPGVEPPAIRHCGVENLSGDSEFKGPEDEAHGWTFIDVVAARDSWVRNVTSTHFGYSCVRVRRDSTAITVQDCSCLDPVSKIEGGRRYSFALDGQLCLVLRCLARGGRHDFVMGSCAPGPNAFVDCRAESSHADSGPHHRWSVGTLYDNLVLRGTQGGGELNVVNRGNSGTGHGWAGANQVIWNCDAEAIHVEQPPTAQNWCIGCEAKSMSGNGYFESNDNKVLPDSLFKAQLAERLGKKAAEHALAKVEVYQ